MYAILDIDGTLIDSSQRHYDVLKDALYSVNIKEYECNDYLDFKRDGHTTFDYLSSVLDLPPITAKIVSQYWIDHIEDDSQLSKDI